MSRTSAIARAEAYFDGGGFLVDLTRRVAIPSSSQEPERASALRSYLLDEIVPALTRLGFTCRLLDNPTGPPVLAAERLENPHLVTALIYGHGDTIRGTRRSVAARTGAMARYGRGRAHLWPRHCRQ